MSKMDNRKTKWIRRFFTKNLIIVELSGAGHHPRTGMFQIIGVQIFDLKWDFLLSIIGIILYCTNKYLL